MSDYFEQRSMKTLKRLQTMRTTARNNVIAAQEQIENVSLSDSELSAAKNALAYWQAQEYALDQSISIVIDPDQLTLWEN